MSPFLGQTPPELIDILDKVHGFYQDSWTNLMWFVGALGGIATLVLGLAPWLLEQRRRKVFKLSEDKISKEIEVAKNKASHDLAEELTAVWEEIGDAQEKAAEELAAVREDIDRAQVELKTKIEIGTAMTRVFQAAQSFRQEQWQDTLFYSFKAIAGFLLYGGKEYIEGVASQLNVAVVCSQRLRVDEVRRPIVVDGLRRIINQFEEKGFLEKYSEEIATLEAAIIRKPPAEDAEQEETAEQGDE